jgi:hypothetical protein
MATHSELRRDSDTITRPTDRAEHDERGASQRRVRTAENATTPSDRQLRQVVPGQNADRAAGDHHAYLLPRP